MSASQTPLTIATDSEEKLAFSQDLASKLMLPFSQIDATSFQLVVTAERIEFRAPDLGKPIWVDFLAGKNAHRRQFGGGRGQPLAKALALKKSATPTIIDVTAGYGRDSFVMANLGCQVTLLERNPIIACLLEDALQRAQQDAIVAEICQKMSLVSCDAIDYLSKLQQRPDIIYMDPMYPQRNKSALVKKEMQLLHQLIGPDSDSEQLLNVAQDTALKRVVVKRPKSAEPIANKKPSTFISSKNTRYDIYL